MLKILIVQPQHFKPHVDRLARGVLGQPRAVKPAAGFAQAMEFSVSYSIGGVPCRGVATVHVAPAYDTAVMAVTAAIA